VPGKLITDNVLVAYEMTHYLFNKRQGNDGYMGLVKWEFVEAMLCKLGFARSYVDLIMQCIKTIKYRIKVNGEYTEEIVPQRGLRQGDPLSPYLFLICAEGFSSLLHNAEINDSIQGIKVCAAAPSITHLLFADDSLILMKADVNNVACLQEIVKVYEACSGQKINMEKSSILFSPNTKLIDREQIKQKLQLASK
jgi:hypothetical protein